MTPSRRSWNYARIAKTVLALTVVATIVTLVIGSRRFVRATNRDTPRTICNVAPREGTPIDPGAFDRIARSRGLDVTRVRGTATAGEIDAFKHTSFFGGFGCAVEYGGGRVLRKRVYWVDG